jgi:peptide/nickel transport system permease protein
MALSKQKREIYKRKIKSFWTDFSHNKIGFIGLIIILGFVVAAIIAPLLTPYQPESQLYQVNRLAMPYAAPSWFTIFPQYSGANPTIYVWPDMSQASLVSQTGNVESSISQLNFNFTSTIDYRGENASVTLDLGNFTYSYSTPPAFTMHVLYNAFFNRTIIRTYFIIQNYTANPLWEEYFKNASQAEMLINIYTPTLVAIAGNVVNQTVDKLHIDSYVDFSRQPVISSLYKPEKMSQAPPDPAAIIFSQRGVYGIKVRFEFESMRDRTTYLFTGAYAQLYVQKIGLTIWGRVQGVFGTDSTGSDAWTELVYGIRISLMVGVLAALIATSLGILYGVVAGYLGGFVDEFLMRIVDVLLCIPVLPILLILTRYFFANVFLVVVLIAIFGWQGLSRVIRSRVLTLKEMSFIESARASGASDTYLMIHHLVPNVLPIAMAAMVLAVPGAIITEAALSFLGFGDPNAPTWGRMLYNAYQLGGLRAPWVWLPPGLAITTICIGFVFIGHAVDEIVNPRLRRRR